MAHPVLWAVRIIRTSISDPDTSITVAVIPLLTMNIENAFFTVCRLLTTVRGPFATVHIISASFFAQVNIAEPVQIAILIVSKAIITFYTLVVYTFIR
jgi:hypothetical protein